MAEYYYMNKELLDKRLIKSNEALVRLYEQMAKLDPSDPDYVEKLKAVAAVHKTVVEDAKNETSRIMETERLRVETEKNDMLAINASEQLELDSKKAEDEKRAGFWRNVMDGIKVAATVGIAGVTTYAGIWKFKQSTKFEENDALLTTTDRTIVQEGLRDDSKRWKLF